MTALPPPPGQRFDVGGYRLHLQRQGQGRPAAVLDSGLAGNSLMWANTLKALAAFTEAAAFDRAGYAWSDPAPAGIPRTSAQMAAELRALLRAAGLGPPYLLVGHSAGAIHALVYTDLYPDEVAGLVLVDPSHPEMFTRAPGVPDGPTIARPYRVIAALGRLGLLRWLGPILLGALLGDSRRHLPPEAWQALLTFSRRSQDYANAAREAESANESFAHAAWALTRLGDRPVEVLSAEWWAAGRGTPMKRAMLGLHRELAGHSTRGRHSLVAGTDHANLPVARPDAVADAVRRILEGRSA